MLERLQGLRVIFSSRFESARTESVVTSVPTGCDPRGCSDIHHKCHDEHRKTEYAGNQSTHPLTSSPVGAQFSTPCAIAAPLCRYPGLSDIPASVDVDLFSQKEILVRISLRCAGSSLKTLIVGSMNLNINCESLQRILTRQSVIL